MVGREQNAVAAEFPPGTNESYLYSQDGLRKEKTNSSGTTLFTWDEQNVLLETSPSGVVLARNTDFPGYWGGLASQNRGGVSNFFGYDSQGSVRILTSILGAITDYYAYMAFGVELATGATTVNPNRYLGLYGYYRDFINWMYVRARLLDALRGRWVSRDELGFDGGDWNLYRDVGNDPVGLTDPTGSVSMSKDICGKPVVLHSYCKDTKPGSQPGETPRPWKIVPDPMRPVTKTKDGNQVKTLFCFIVVDQFCNAYSNPNTRIDERVKPVVDGPIDLDPLSFWTTDPAWNSLPRFCDPMIGKSGTAVSQCYRVYDMNPTGEIIITILEPCPMLISYGAGVRRAPRSHSEARCCRQHYAPAPCESYCVCACCCRVSSDIGRRGAGGERHAPFGGRVACGMTTAQSETHPPPAR